MKAILFLAGGTLAVLIFLFAVKKFIATPENIFFFSLSSEKSLSELSDAIANRLSKEGMKVKTVGKSEEHVRLLSCEPAKVRNILIKAPFFSLLLPCEIILESGKSETTVSSVKEAFLIGYYSDKLKEEEIRSLINQFHKLRVIMAEAVK